MTEGRPGRTAPTREVITVGQERITIDRPDPAVRDGSTVVSGAELLRMLSVLDNRLRPENYDKADGAPLRVFDSPSVKVDVSKRSVEDMGFWHRSADYNEIIFCFRGALRWETELGTVTLHPGELILIPKGITHRSMLCEDSAEENVLIELKVRDALKYVGG